jgi:hypothetical protein
LFYHSGRERSGYLADSTFKTLLCEPHFLSLKIPFLRKYTTFCRVWYDYPVLTAGKFIWIFGHVFPMQYTNLNCKFRLNQQVSNLPTPLREKLQRFRWIWQCAGKNQSYALIYQQSIHFLWKILDFDTTAIWFFVCMQNRLSTPLFRWLHNWSIA